MPDAKITQLTEVTSADLSTDWLAIVDEAADTKKITVGNLLNTIGSWTPVIGGEGGTSGQSYTTQQGTYIKVGRLVIAIFNVLFSDKGTITGDVEVQGLPFTVDDSISNFGAFFLRWNDVPGTPINAFGVPHGATTTANLFWITAADSTPNRMVTADIGNTSNFSGTIIYIAD